MSPVEAQHKHPLALFTLFAFFGGFFTLFLLVFVCLLLLFVLSLLLLRVEHRFFHGVVHLLGKFVLRQHFNMTFVSLAVALAKIGDNARDNGDDHNKGHRFGQKQAVFH